jgi:hypothetical protein
MGYWDDVTPHSVANAQDGFKEFQIGDNDAFVKSVQEKISESGNPMLVITFANDEGAEIRHFIVDGEFKLQKLKQFYIAFGIPLGSRDFEEWRGRRGIVVCKQGTPYNGKVYNQVSYLRPKLKSPSNPPPAHNAQRSQPTQQPAQRPVQQPAYFDNTGDAFGNQNHSDDGFDDDIPF